MRADPALTAAPALPAMARRLTVPFAAGADLLELTLGPGPGPDRLVVAPYGFAEHLARFGSLPEVCYVLRVLVSCEPACHLDVTLTDPGLGSATTRLDLGARSEPGDSAVIPLPAGASADTRITALRLTVDQPDPVAAADRYQVTALLGTTARLLWVLGVERDRLTQRRQQIRDQRQVATASGTSLDLIGADLAVPRFPPTPYSVDPDTVALYHLDDLPGAAPAVADATAPFPGRTPHPGALTGAIRPGAGGLWDGGLGLDGGAARIAGHPDFDVSAADGFTAELFVRPGAGSALGSVLRRTAGPVGWSIEIGDLGLGTANAVRATLGDGTAEVVVVAGVELPRDRFSQVAAVLRRDPTPTWSLIVGGLTVATADASAIAAVEPAADVVAGDSPFRGLIDEIRLSGVARTDFHPALGEGDEQYRRRLSLFRRWVLPTPTALQDSLNQLVPQLGGQADPFVVSDADGPTDSGHLVLRVYPRLLAPHQRIDADGRLSGAEPANPDWVAVDPALLGRSANPGVAYPPARPEPDRPLGLPDPDPALMQPPVAAALDRLVTLLAGDGLPGRLSVVAGYDVAAGDLRSAGLGVVLRHVAAGPGRLAALAHRAGFDLVTNRGDGTAYATCAPGRLLLLGPAGSGVMAQTGGLPELTVGDSVTLTFAQSTPTYAAAVPPAGSQVDFALVPVGQGRATLVQASPAEATATLTATAPGLVSVTADLLAGPLAATISCSLLVRPAPLADGASIAADGALGVALASVGPAEDPFDPALLPSITEPRIDFGADPLHRRMQPTVGRHLLRLADLLQAGGVPGSLVVERAYDPGAPATDLASRGRVLVLTHPSLAAGPLAVQAHRAGFGYVARSGGQVQVGDPAGDLVTVDGPAAVEVGATVTLSVTPDPAAVSPTTRLSWSSGQPVATTPGQQGVAVRTTSTTDVEVSGVAPGRAWVLASLREAGAAGPYALTVALRPELAGARISRDDYYLVMNALNTLRPLGVEVRTEAIRAAVVELGSNPSGLDPSFTYPPFRLHRAAGSLTRQGDSDG
ncbi:MAG TPA: LamG-like jellyroll fold domain-containing protein [Candidatus Nanopelagicales bacterium]|nr:LamG-like jellyroll fold domain-containing protein [Candidatus Nanopelagicales bacterium]